MKDFLTWPLIRSDPENNPPKLAPPALRYAAGGGIFVLSSLCSLYFFYAPSRYVCRGPGAADRSMVTRITLFPHSQRLVLRTANPPPSRWLPKAVQRRAFFQRAGTVSSADPRDREMQLDDVFRLQGSAVGAELYQLGNLTRRGVKLPQAAQALVAKSGPLIPKTDQQDAILLRVGDARLAFQLTAAPQRASLLGEPQPHGVRGAFHRMLRSPTDWGVPAGYEAPVAERTAYGERAKRRADTEPWFLDRAKFDRLFPLDRTRYRK